MAASEPNTALPLNEAAARFGITPDALRMRLRRGKVRGFKRSGRLFVYPDQAANTASEQPAGRFGTEAAPQADRTRRSRSAGRPAQRAELAVVVEFQKIELDRILRENERLNRRITELLDELRHLREIQQREQILRQQDQNLRAQEQSILERIVGRLGLPAPPPDDARAAQAAAKPPTEPVPEPAPEPAPELASEAAPELALTSDADGPPEAPEAARPAAAPLAEAETAALAEILREVGQSLREPPEAPPPRPPDPGAQEADGAASPTEEERRNAARIMRRLLRARRDDGEAEH